ncbi:Imm1 family immunity protein [Krasilnikovia cinnamomea]|uniref:Imm1 family immunity protein n=1 Tax=Krasilnikovia cinnamomea TaxID=349313 RepID=UPI00102BD245|nr:Imm1 family immunity protein [Krasilnikovia cinnamomea]
MSLLTTFTVRWDNGKKSVLVEDIEQLDTALDQIENERGPKGRVFVVDITNGRNANGVARGLHMTVGHPVRNRVFWMGPGDNVGFEPELEPWNGDAIEFDYGHLPTEETPETLRVSRMKAREAAREFIRTNERPTCLAWQTVPSPAT